jgi:SET domain-containing protein
MLHLKVANKVEVKESPIHGLGVFAIEEIKSGELIEECHLITLPLKQNQYLFFLCNYKFIYKHNNSDITEYVIPLGNGCIYNHSDNNNAYWKNHPTHKAFQFIASKDIMIGEEICTYYNDTTDWKLIEYHANRDTKLSII